MPYQIVLPILKLQVSMDRNTLSEHPTFIKFYTFIKLGNSTSYIQDIDSKST